MLLQDIVEGEQPARAVHMNGFSHCKEAEGTVCARLYDIYPPQVFLKEPSYT